MSRATKFTVHRYDIPNVLHFPNRLKVSTAWNSETTFEADTTGKSYKEFTTLEHSVNCLIGCPLCRQCTFLTPPRHGIHAASQRMFDSFA